MTSEANRGKVAEGLMKKALQNLEKHSHNLCFERIPDARSSRGMSSNPRDGDFVIYHSGKNILIELKEVGHDYRLPKSNFPNDQKARLRKRQLAGTICRVVVYHSTTGVWRLLELDYFDLGVTGSYDLTSTKQYTLKEVIECLTDL